MNFPCEITVEPLCREITVVIRASSSQRLDAQERAVRAACDMISEAGDEWRNMDFASRLVGMKQCINRLESALLGLQQAGPDWDDLPQPDI